MPEETELAKAELQELDAKFKNQINKDKAVKVQFNPETLKVSFQNQLQQPQGGGDQRGPQTQQFVGAGTTKLSLQLWFDVTALNAQGPNDVRKLTQRVAYFIKPKPNPKSETQLIPPAVRLLWGTFKFDGIMDSLEESLEFFSPDGRPLRANLSISISQQQITEYGFGEAKPAAAGRGGAGRGGAPATPGTSPLTQAPKGASLPGLAASAGLAASWPSIALANGIEDPLRLKPGALIDLNLRAPSISVSGPAVVTAPAFGVGASAQVSVSGPTATASARFGG